jgi:hypothetical protein
MLLGKGHKRRHDRRNPTKTTIKASAIAPPKSTA